MNGNKIALQFLIGLYKICKWNY